MRENVVIRTVSRLSVPFIQLFGLYVIIHGASGAGGGFQGGIALASSFILMIIAFGVADVKRRINEKGIMIYSIVGILLFILTGLLSLLFAGNFLQLNVIEEAFGIAGLHAILTDIVEVGIGITVMAVMISIIYDMAEREDESS